jgi:hypothetical protein
VLSGDRAAAQRAQETETHSDTACTLQRRFRQQGMAGLLPADVELVPRRRASPVPDAVRQEIDRFKALYDGFHYRELARILFIKFRHPIDQVIRLYYQGWAKVSIVRVLQVSRPTVNAWIRRFEAKHYGCVTLHHYHFYVEAGLPQTQVLLWVSGEQLRAAFENVVVAEDHCHYDWQGCKVKDIQGGVFYPTRFASP